LSTGSFLALSLNMPKPGAYFNLNGSVASETLKALAGLEIPKMAGAATIADPVITAFLIKLLLEFSIKLILFQVCKLLPV
jgi:hypothetical protein